MILDFHLTFKKQVGNRSKVGSGKYKKTLHLGPVYDNIKVIFPLLRGGGRLISVISYWNYNVFVFLYSFESSVHVV